MKKIFLTGASSGIGLAIAETLCAHGHEVWGTSRAVQRLPSLGHFHPVSLDLDDSDSIAEGFRGALNEAETFDVVINNAGSGHFGPGQLLTQEEIIAQFQLIVFGQIQIVRLALESMQKRETGLIVNISSLAARLPVPYMAAYNAAKAAMASFTMTMQLELSHTKIRLVDVQPADIRTNFNDAIPGAGSDSADARVTKIWRKVDHNMRTAPKPELVGERILKLIDERNPPPRITIGNFFQATVAPVIDQFLPQRLRLWGLRNYYGI